MILLCVRPLPLKCHQKTPTTTITTTNTATAVVIVLPFPPKSAGASASPSTCWIKSKHDAPWGSWSRMSLYLENWSCNHSAGRRSYLRARDSKHDAPWGSWSKTSLCQENWSCNHSAHISSDPPKKELESGNQRFCRSPGNRLYVSLWYRI